MNCPRCEKELKLNTRTNEASCKDCNINLHPEYNGSSGNYKVDEYTIYIHNGKASIVSRKLNFTLPKARWNLTKEDIEKYAVLDDGKSKSFPVGCTGAPAYCSAIVSACDAGITSKADAIKLLK